MVSFRDSLLKNMQFRKVIIAHGFLLRNIINSKFNVVPFEIVDDIYRVTITSPLNGCHLNLPVIEDHLSLPSTCSSVFIGKGFSIQNFSLKKMIFLLDSGKLLLIVMGLHLIAPTNGTDYILTIMDPETLARELKLEEKFYSVMCALFFSIGICIAGVLVYRWWSKRKIQLEMKKTRKEIIRQPENRTNNLKRTIHLLV